MRAALCSGRYVATQALLAPLPLSLHVPRLVDRMHTVDWRRLGEEQIQDDSLKRCLEVFFKLQRNSHLVLKNRKRLFTESRDS